MLRYIQLFRERLPYKWGKAYVTKLKVIMGNDGFYSCLSEPQGVSTWWKETAQTHVFVHSCSLLLNHLKPQSSKAKLLLPIMPIGIVANTSTPLWDNLCRNSCIHVAICTHKTHFTRLWSFMELTYLLFNLR